jgi:hypothetical protein
MVNVFGFYNFDTAKTLGIDANVLIGVRVD